MPENKDSDWDWAEFVARNNNELVATWGNLANRVLSFCYRTWDGRVPDIDLAASAALLTGTCWPTSTAPSTRLGRNSKPCTCAPRCRRPCDLLRWSINTWTRLLPGHTLKHNRAEAALSVYTALRAIDSLKILFAPFLAVHVPAAARILRLRGAACSASSMSRTFQGLAG